MELFLFGTMWFWVASAILISGVIISVCSDSGIGATMCALCFALFLQYGAKIDITGSIIHHPFITIMAVIGYIVIGIVWMIMKWQFLFRAVASAYSTAREQWYEYMKSENMYPTETPEQLMASFPTRSQTSIMDIRRRFGVRNLPMRVRDEYPSLFFWAAYWPISFVITVLNDPIRKLFRTVIRGLSGIMQTMSDKEFNKYKELYK